MLLSLFYIMIHIYNIIYEPWYSTNSNEDKQTDFKKVNKLYSFKFKLIKFKCRIISIIWTRCSNCLPRLIHNGKYII